MKWKYNNNGDATTEPAQPNVFAGSPIIIHNNTDTSAQGIRVQNNNVFYYTDVTEQSALELNYTLADLSFKLLPLEQIMPGTKPVINLHINSYGGSLFAAMATIDVIKRLPLKVNTIIDGAAASAATLISVVGAHRTIGANSMMLIHQLSTGAYGKYSELEDNMENCKRLMTGLKSIYKQYTKVPMKKIDEILNHDLWFDAKTCLEYGLVDEIR